MVIFKIIKLFCLILLIIIVAGCKPVQYQETSNGTLTGSLNVESEPNQTEIYIDGLFIGKTPLLITNLSIGNHKLTLKKAKYKDFNQEVNIIPGQTLSTKASY